jgi:hypothetical protein
MQCLMVGECTVVSIYTISQYTSIYAACDKVANKIVRKQRQWLSWALDGWCQLHVVTPNDSAGPRGLSLCVSCGFY